MKAEYKVYIARVDAKTGYSAGAAELVALFGAKGDAIAYAIHRYHTDNANGVTAVFTVEKRGKREYYAG
jgi:hypothetical protein